MTSGTYRDVTMAYDGHGRMAARHYPIEDTSANTTWTYNADDSIDAVADPRGVVTDFTYNSTTGFMTGIAYTVPGSLSNVNDTPDVSFSYDNLGNRTGMTDGTGSTSYTYNSISQMTSETKSFTGLSGSFTMDYTYNLSGGLKTITDPQDSSRKAIYAHDKLGRVTGADMLEGSTTTSYIHDTKYRAWGGYKEIVYKPYTGATSESTAGFTYDNRLQISGYEAEGGSQASVLAYFTRYNDGKVRTATANSVTNDDYLYTYDYAGRLAKGYSGKDAHGDSQMQPGPFKHDYAYSGFSETTGVTGKNWGITIHELAKSYANYTGRDSNTGYDAAGNVVTDRVQTLPSVLNRTLKYDAAGRQVEIFDPAIHSTEANMTYKSYYDSDGRQVKKEDISTNWTITTYDLRSTVLGGEKVGEFDGASSEKFMVPVLGGVLKYMPVSGGPSVTYTRDAPEGYGYDPRGAPVGEEPGTSFTGGNGQFYPEFPDASNANRCAWEGLAMSCEMKDRLSENAGRIAVLIDRDSKRKGRTGPKPGPPPSPPGTSIEPQTSKPVPGPASGSPIVPASLPCIESDEDPIVICTDAPAYDLGDSGRRNLTRDKPFPGRKLTTKEVKKIADDIKLILDSNPNCASFIAGVLGHAQTDSNPVVDTNPITVLWAIHQQNGFYEVPNLGAGGYTIGRIADGDARVELNSRNYNLQGVSKASAREFQRDSDLAVADAALAEVLHHSGAFTYDDRDMSLALAAHMKIPPPNYGWKVTQDIANWSLWWHPKTGGPCNLIRARNAERNKRKR